MAKTLETSIEIAGVLSPSLRAAVSEAVQKLEKMSQETLDAAGAAEKLAAEISTQETVLKSLKRGYADYIVNGQESSEEAMELAQHIEKLSGELDENQGKLRGAYQAADKLASGMNETDTVADKLDKSLEETGDAAKKADEGFTVFKATLANLASSGIQTGIEAVKNLGSEIVDLGMDLSGATSQMQASTGLSASAMRRYKNVMKGIRRDNFGEDYKDVADAMTEVVQIMGELDDDNMKDVTESAITLQDTFDMDVNESIRAADVMMKTMGVDAEAAFDLITKGAQNGLNRSGELVDNITEYGQIWGQAGFSAEEMFAILENGLDSGAYNLDKVNDYVKEFGNSLADGRIEKNLDAFSDDTKELFKAWKKGEATTSDVFYSVINDLSEMTNQQEALTLASEVWSALGEDNAMQVLTALDDVNDKYKDVKGSMDSLKEVKYGDLETSISGLGNALKENIVTPIAEAALPTITSLFQGATEVINGIGEALGPQKTELEQFIEDIGLSNDEVQKSLENAQSIVDGATADVSELEQYKTILMHLNEQERLDEYQKYQLRNAVQALGNSVPGLTEAFDSQTGSLTATNQELEKMFDNAEAVAMQNALVKAQAESYDALAQATIDVARSESALQQAEKARSDYLAADAKRAEDIANGNAALKVTEEIQELNGAVEAAKKNLSEANETAATAEKQIKDESKVLKELEEEYGLLPDATDQATDGIENTGNAADDAAKKIDEYGNDLTDLSDEEAAAVTEASRQIVEAYENMRSGIADSIRSSMSLFDEFSGGTEVTAAQINANLESQKAGIERWSQNMQTLAGEIGNGFSQELYDELASMGPEQGANAVQSLVDALNSGSGEFEEVSSNWSELLKLQENAEAIADATTQGKTLAQGYVAGIEEGEPEVQAAIAKFGTLSGTTTDAGRVLTEEVALSIKANSGVVADAVTEMLEPIRPTVEAAMHEIGTQFDNAGSLLSGKAQGISANIENSFQTGMANARRTVETELNSISAAFANCRLQLPHISLPHFSVSGTLSLNPPQVPNISVSWYKEGGILTQPTAFGAYGNTLLAGGEAGAEAVLPLATLWEEMEQRLQNVLDSASPVSRSGETGLISSAGRLLALEDFSLGSMANGGGVVVYYDFSGFHWNPQVQTNGSDNDIMSELKAHEAEFFDWLDDFVKTREAAQYA